MYEGETIKYLTSNEKEALFHVIENDTSLHSIRNRAIFFLAEYCGLRASEVGKLRISDFDIQKKEIYVRRLKGSKNNTLRILDAYVYDALLEYISLRKSNTISSDLMFISQKGNPISRKTIDDIMKKYCSLAGIPKDKSHFHVLKHTRTITLAELGLDTKEVQNWIGHKSVRNTEIYLQFTSRQQETLYQKYEFLKRSKGYFYE